MHISSRTLKKRPSKSPHMPDQTVILIFVGVQPILCQHQTKESTTPRHTWGRLSAAAEMGVPPEAYARKAPHDCFTRGHSGNQPSPLPPRPYCCGCYFFKDCWSCCGHLRMCPKRTVVQGEHSRLLHACPRPQNTNSSPVDPIALNHCLFPSARIKNPAHGVPIPRVFFLSP